MAFKSDISNDGPIAKMAGGSSKQDKAQQKALEKQKQKILEDKTFGLKNKKGKAVQKWVCHTRE